MQVHINSTEVERSHKVAACFDFDGTLVTTKSDRKFACHVNDWKFIDARIPTVLKNIVDVEGKRLVIFTNQTVRFKEQMIYNVLQSIGILDKVDVYIAYDKKMKKPSKAMYDVAFDTKPHPNGSYFVGDALGRDGDWSDSDKLFAEACGFPYFHPSDFFDYC